MFGATTGATQPANSGFNFSTGASTTPAAASGGFGFGATSAAPTGGFSFGGTAASATPAATSSGFNFSATPAHAVTPAPAASSSFSFGGPIAATPSPASSGFSFGGTTVTPSVSNTGFGFSGTSAAPAASSGFNFGGTSATPAASNPGFQFGGTASTIPTGFGATANPSIFGQTPATGSGFGFNPKPLTPSTGFGFNTGASTTGTSAFGAPSTTKSSLFSNFGAPSSSAIPSPFGAAPGALTTLTPIIVGADASVAQLNSVQAAYQDPVQSRFKFFMYNTVDPTLRHLYTRPPHISERLWNQAELDNPDPLNCVPVPIVGFDNLLKRIKAQQEHAEKCNKYTEDLRAQLVEMDKQTRATEEKLEKCRHKHVQLFHALVKAMKDIEFLQNYGKPLQREEMELATALKKLQTLLDSPGQYKARLADAVSMQQMQKEAQPPLTSHLSPQDLERVYELLDKQRQGLELLTNTINEDLADMELIKEMWRSVLFAAVLVVGIHVTEARQTGEEEAEMTDTTRESGGPLGSRLGGHPLVCFSLGRHARSHQKKSERERGRLLWKG
ncbi:uncharacterized protein CCR75_008040 [Bremia lactucae]|uniref:Nucleoporin Nup54 alpha-helical domain-containing protein n=1 Tax=Bremia lactucae TaxID=4779 RepID=A0A976ILT4_BRELC|nr:hypothetical protein CCR75_008040 [Bremia lactucae]